MAQSPLSKTGRTLIFCVSRLFAGQMASLIRRLSMEPKPSTSDITGFYPLGVVALIFLLMPSPFMEAACGIFSRYRLLMFASNAAHKTSIEMN